MGEIAQISAATGPSQPPGILSRQKSAPEEPLLSVDFFPKHEHLVVCAPVAFLGFRDGRTVVIFVPEFDDMEPAAVHVEMDASLPPLSRPPGRCPCCGLPAARTTTPARPGPPPCRCGGQRRICKTVLPVQSLPLLQIRPEEVLHLVVRDDAGLTPTEFLG